MKFNVQRVLTPAYLTSVALVVVGVVLALAYYPVAAWLFVLLGLGLNAVAVSVTAINDAPRAPRAAGSRRPGLPVRRPRASDDAPALGDRPEPEAPLRRPADPEAETAENPVVPPAAGSTSLSSRG
ncbi:hypothetical protein LQU92_03765 [Kocuria sp. LUK]|uniref:hypothetical protein n=1 Tax=Kocuria TaxID=57493 RepID=UPI001E2FDBFE|nr:hypothetical protein [Kocuria sp. LUK]MCD1144359.1 hypothetical protein [Kocuria sp. LUK]